MNKVPMTESPELLESEKELERVITAILESAVAGPVIADVCNAGYCEDGKTFVVICNALDGSTIVWSFVPGESVTPFIAMDPDNGPATSWSEDEIILDDEGSALGISSEASLQMSDAPTGGATTRVTQTLDRITYWGRPK